MFYDVIPVKNLKDCGVQIMHLGNAFRIMFHIVWYSSVRLSDSFRPEVITAKLRRRSRPHEPATRVTMEALGLRQSPFCCLGACVRGILSRRIPLHSFQKIPHSKHQLKWIRGTTTLREVNWHGYLDDVTWGHVYVELRRRVPGEIKGLFLRCFSQLCQ